MDWKTFVAQMTNALAWPLAIIGILYYLKDMLIETLPRIKKLKLSNTELEFFQKEIEELAKDAKTQIISIRDEKDTELKRQYDFLVRLAEISPRSAIIESFRIVEAAIYKALIRKYPDVEHQRRVSLMEALRMLQGSLIDKELYQQLQRMRHIRNEAAHVENLNISDMPVEAYIDIALSTAKRLEENET